MSYYIHQNGKVEKEAVDNLDRLLWSGRPSTLAQTQQSRSKVCRDGESHCLPSTRSECRKGKGASRICSNATYNTPPTQTILTLHPLLPTPLVIPLTSFPAVHLSQYVASWLVGWLLCWLLGCFFLLLGWLLGCLVGFLVGWLVAWLVGWLVGLLVCWLVGWLVGSLLGWLVGCFVGCSLVDWFTVRNVV